MRTISIVLAIALASVAQAISRADPPYFPANCKAPSVTPEIRDLPERDFFGRKVYLCVKVGETCKASKDCTRPPVSECHKERTDRKSVFAGYATCIDGFCRIISDKKESPCDCLAGCDLKDFDRDLSCIEGRCKAAECAPCGEFPNNRACCAPGVKGQDGRCFCGTGAGEGCATNREQCDSGAFNDTCCGRGTDNEGKCCASGSCNGRCLHQPK
ncbi:uncharacterized protein FIESC28_01129 [Fusarium coffeatum]|uniref:Uncharacterized protein n=1 Tax=Fusarium coffeatum TaxID=231269 RepID=A0A366S9W3_9HYPO|nr:uncharacterized protein FIESC28_01129 [Fusarium coffeatum]RBR26101.1 hypothetical protein FIESC28_01129 [Fusarium coffeatum]